VREFSTDIAAWNECQTVISTGVTFINENGISHGAAGKLRHNIGDSHASASSIDIARRLVEFVQESEDLLGEGQRLPMSTEILESSFGLYKPLERQHSNGGFTSLLAAFGRLLQATTPESIKRDFARVPVKRMRQWVTDNLGKTLTSKRKTAYHEFTHAA